MGLFFSRLSLFWRWVVFLWVVFFVYNRQNKMSTVEQRNPGYYYKVWLLSRWVPATLPGVVQLIMEFSTPFFDFLHCTLPLAIFCFQPEAGVLDSHDDLVVMVASGMERLYEGRVVKLHLNAFLTDLRGVWVLTESSTIRALKVFAVKFLTNPSDLNYVRLACMSSVVLSDNAADIWTFFPTFRSRAILVCMLLAQSEMYAQRVVDLVRWLVCAETEKQKLLRIGCLAFCQLYEQEQMPEAFRPFEPLAKRARN
jgi:hypothetical protein